MAGSRLAFDFVMATFEHVLVPVDLEEPSNCALEFAMGLASGSGAKLTLVHASSVAMLVYAGYDYIGYRPGLADDLANAARKRLDDVVAKLKERCPNVEGVVVVDEPEEAILRTAQERQADLIVIGTHGRHGLSRLVLGSVAERVVRCSPIPVLTMFGREERDARMRELA